VRFTGPAMHAGPVSCGAPLAVKPAWRFTVSAMLIAHPERVPEVAVIPLARRATRRDGNQLHKFASRVW